MNKKGSVPEVVKYADGSVGARVKMLWRGAYKAPLMRGKHVFPLPH